jgi:hypothetical protein
MHDVVRELRQPALRLQHVLLELTKPATVEVVARGDQSARRQLLQPSHDAGLFGLRSMQRLFDRSQDELHARVVLSASRLADCALKNGRTFVRARKSPLPAN